MCVAEELKHQRPGTAKEGNRTQQKADACTMESVACKHNQLLHCVQG